LEYEEDSEVDSDDADDHHYATVGLPAAAAAPSILEAAEIEAQNNEIRELFDANGDDNREFELAVAAANESAAVASSSNIAAAGVEQLGLNNILQLEIIARVDAIRDADVKKEVKWENVMKHLVSHLDMPESHATFAIQLLKGSGIDPKISTIPETGQSLMRPPKAEMNANRLKYMYVIIYSSMYNVV
jgi:hypothetical protein